MVILAWSPAHWAQVFPFLQSEKDIITKGLSDIDVRLTELIDQLEAEISWMKASGICTEIKMAARLEILRNIFLKMIAAIRSDETLEIYRSDFGVGQTGVQAVSPDRRRNLKTIITGTNWVAFNDGYLPLADRWTNVSDIEFHQTLAHELFHLEGDLYLDKMDPFKRETLDGNKFGPLYDAGNVESLFADTDVVDWSPFKIRNRTSPGGIFSGTNWKDFPGVFAPKK